MPCIPLFNISPLIGPRSLVRVLLVPSARLHSSYTTHFAHLAMHAPQPARDRDPMSDTLQSVLQLSLPYCTLLDIVSVSNCGVQIAKLCRSQLSAGNNRLAHILLHAAVNDAAGFDLAPTGKGSKQKRLVVEKQLQQFRRSVLWLVDAIGSKPLFNPVGTDSAAQRDLTEVLVQRGTAVVPLELAERLVQSGLRVSYSDLVSSARAGVSGIGLWPTAMQQCGADTDIPAWAKYAALGTYEWSNVYVPIASLSSQELADYMFLVANGLPSSDNGKPSRRLNMQLFQMSLILQHDAARDIAPNDIVGLMKLVSRSPIVNWEHTLQALLCKLPGAAGISTEQITQPGDGLLESAIRNRDGFLAGISLELLPASKGISPETVHRCLKVLIEIAGRRVKVEDKLAAEGIPQMLVSSGPAKQIPSAAAADLVRMGLETRDKKVEGLVHQFMQLPSFKRTDPRILWGLMQYAVQMGMPQIELLIANIAE